MTLSVDRDTLVKKQINRLLNGEVVDVVDAGWYRDKFAMGDLEKAGLVGKHMQKSPTNLGFYADERWEVVGDITIRLHGKEYKKGDKTEWVSRPI